MSVNGNLDTMVMADLIQWLALGRKSGCLYMEGVHFEKKIWFREGNIVSAESTDPREFLGQLLLQKGVIGEEDLKKALDTQKKTGVFLGRILMMVHLLDEDRVRAVLQDQIEEIVFSVFLWDKGTFKFKDDEQPPANRMEIKMDAMEVVMEGARRRDEWIEARHVFPEGAVIRLAGPLLSGQLDPESPAGRVVELLQEEKSFERLCLELHSSDYAVVRQLHDMYLNGIVEAIVPEALKVEESPDDEFLETLLDAARTQMAAGNFREALDAIEAALATDPGSPEPRRLKREAEERFKQSTLQDDVPLDHIPVLLKELSELEGTELTPAEGFVISRINGMWDVSSISKISSMRELETISIFQTLLQRGIIELRPPQKETLN